MASIVMGILVSLQFRNQTTANKSTSKQPELIAMIKNLEEERDKITQELQATRARLGEMEGRLGQEGNGFAE